MSSAAVTSAAHVQQASSSALASSTVSLSHEPSAADTSMVIDALASAPMLPQLSSSQLLGSSGLGRRQPLSAIAGGVNAAAPATEHGGALASSSLASSKLGASRVLLAPRGNGGGGVVNAAAAVNSEKEGECAQQ